MEVSSTRGFVFTTSIKKLRKMRERVKVVCGGSSAGKTFGILPVLIDRATRVGGLEISVVSESVPHLRRGAMKDFKKIMMSTGRWFEERWNISLMTYSFANGSYIEFFSADDQGKVRGPRRNILYVNECNNIPYETYFQLAIRTSDEVWLDYNPVEDFWVNEQLIGQPGVEFMRLTYKDNEALPESIVDELEKCRDKGFWDPHLGEGDLFKESNIRNPYWARWWRVYGLGFEGVLEGVIFQNWSKVGVIPPMAKFLGYGLDFGYANDPTAVVGMWKHGDGYYLREFVYEKGLTNQDLGRVLRDYGVGTTDFIVADSSEPKSIEELRRMGFKGIRKAKKGKDSILHGISLMQSVEFFVTEDSVNLIKELRGYVWQTDRDGKTINKPSEENNHCFVGDTMIQTEFGLKRIDSMEVGDFVMTSEGLMEVLKVFDNGVKEVNKYWMQFDTFSVYLECTKDHKIKTEEGWKMIKDLKSGDYLTLSRNSMANCTGFTSENAISAEGIKDYIGLYGLTIMGLFLTVITSIILMGISQTIALITLVWFVLNFIKSLRVRSVLKTIRSGLRIFMPRVLKRLRNGINQKKESSGIQNTQRGLILEILLMARKSVSTVKKYLFSNHQRANSVQTNVNLHGEGNRVLMMSNGFALNAEKYLSSTDIQKSKLVEISVLSTRESQVYDLMVDDCHEYFANGVLVHNCIDSTRYIAQAKIGKSGGFVVSSGKVIYSN